MGAVSVAFEPNAAFWDSAFALADRLERTEPARAELAPLRARVNLLAAAAGVRLEVDLWPHLRGVTASIMGDPEQPGRPSGALLVLHADLDASAERLAGDVLPRLGARLSARKQGEEHPRAAPRAGPGTAIPSARSLGVVDGKPLWAARHGRDVIVAWGEGVLNACRDAAGKPERSIAPYCTGWAREGNAAPQRVGAFWPARSWPTPRGLGGMTPAYRALADDPPVVWWGWNESGKAHDSIRYSDLRQRVRRFLDQVPLDPPPIR
jgi:hypothetical protein